MSINIDPIGTVVTSDTDDSFIPSWLTTTPPLSPPDYKAILRESLLVQYETLFIRLVDGVASGLTNSTAIGNDLTPIEKGAFMRWVKRDPQRESVLKEAEEERTRVWAGEIISIADADDSVEDVNRSKLRIDSRKWLMAADHRRKYGESKTIEMGTTISILAAMNENDDRLAKMIKDQELVEDILAKSQDGDDAEAQIE